MLSGFAAWAQPFGPSASFFVPEVKEDRSVTFKVKAPEANRIGVQIQMHNYDLSKGEDGTWTCTTDPLTPGFQSYTMSIDGLSVINPSGDMYQSYMRPMNGLDIPEEGCGDFERQDIPHGKISIVTYWSDVCGEWRELRVYTPYGYDKSGKDYPVLYLQHGGGEDQTAWFGQGKAANILDAAIAGGKAVPMIVVCANGNTPGGVQYSWKGVQSFRSELLQHIIPTVEKEFRTITDRDHRALAGLSMGGGLSFFIGLHSPETFSHVGVFSAGMFSGFGRKEDVDLEAEIPGIFTDTGTFNSNFDYFLMTCGEQDMRIEGITKAFEGMRGKGVEVDLKTYPGDHEWQVWRKSFRDFIPKLFR